MFDKSIDHPQYQSHFAIILSQYTVLIKKKAFSCVPPRGFIQSIEKINCSHTIHYLALLLGWLKMLLGHSAVLSD